MLYSITEVISVIEYNDAHGFCMVDVAFSDQNPVLLIDEMASYFVNEHIKNKLLCEWSMHMEIMAREYIERGHDKRIGSGGE